MSRMPTDLALIARFAVTFWETFRYQKQEVVVMRAETALARVGAKTAAGAAVGWLISVPVLGALVGLGFGVYHEVWRAKRGL